MPLVTLSASYGAGGSHVGPALAERLDVPFLDRAIPTGVAERLAVPLRHALERDQSVSGVLDRLLQSLAPAAGAYAAASLPDEARLGDHDFRAATEAVIREHAACGDAVILGRSAAVVLRDDPRALHVRLDGPHDRRLIQAMRIEGIDRETAERQMGETDRAREAYARHFYHVDPHAPELYHLVIDATAVELDACVDLIACAALGRTSPLVGG